MVCVWWWLLVVGASVNDVYGVCVCSMCSYVEWLRIHSRERIEINLDCCY